jgi:hypothetical protein
MALDPFDLLTTQELRSAEGTNGTPLSFPISLWSYFLIFLYFIARRHRSTTGNIVAAPIGSNARVRMNCCTMVMY